MDELQRGTDLGEFRGKLDHVLLLPGSPVPGQVAGVGQMGRQVLQVLPTCIVHRVVGTPISTHIRTPPKLPFLHILSGHCMMQPLDLDPGCFSRVVLEQLQIIPFKFAEVKGSLISAVRVPQ